MKRLLTSSLVLVLAFTLVACGAKEAVQDAVRDVLDDTSTQSSAPSSQVVVSSSDTAPADSSFPSGAAMDSLIQWMQDGSFSYDFEMTSEGGGQTTEATGSMAMNGSDMAIRMEMTQDGQLVQSRIILKDGKTYIVDDASKMIMEMSGGLDPEMTGGMVTDYSGITKVGEGTGEIGGKTLPYEEYTESETGSTVRFYLDGGQVYGIESEYEGYTTTMIIINASNQAPADAFELPADYTTMAI